MLEKSGKKTKQTNLSVSNSLINGGELVKCGGLLPITSVDDARFKSVKFIFQQ